MPIGLEIHVQLNTRTKLFCSCPIEEDAKPNTNVCEVCLGYPGAKPRLNKKALELAIKIAKALNCKIRDKILFSRKVYFYPDLPKNYQITQYDTTLGVNGYLELSNGKKIRIRELHIEEDPAKIVEHKDGYILLDFNRSGTPLVEIVTEPDFSSVEEVKEFMKKLLAILDYLDAFDPNKGIIKADVNVSVEGGERVEVKNVTGVKNIEAAINYELTRQTEIIKSGGKIERETRHFIEKSKRTISARKKEFEEDYGYIFDTDLPYYETFDVSLPKMPWEVKEELIKLGVKENLAEAIAYYSKDYGLGFLELAYANKDIANELAKWYQVFFELEKPFSEIKPLLSEFVEAVKLYLQGKLNNQGIRKSILEGVKIGSILKASENYLVMEVSDDLIREAIENNKKAVEDYLKGKKNAINALVGYIMKKTKGRVDPKLAREKLERYLESYSSKR